MKKIMSVLITTIFLAGTFLTAAECSTPPERSKRSDDGPPQLGLCHSRFFLGADSLVSPEQSMETSTEKIFYHLHCNSFGAAHDYWLERR